MRVPGLPTAVLALAAILAAGCAGYQPRAFTLEWEVSDAAGGPALNGRIYNPYTLPARRIKLLVEGLDESGAVINNRFTVVESIVRSRESMPFSVAVESAAQYRVSVLSWDLITPGGGPGGGGGSRR